MRSIKVAQILQLLDGRVANIHPELLPSPINPLHSCSSWNDVLTVKGIFLEFLYRRSLQLILALSLIQDLFVLDKPYAGASFQLTIAMSQRLCRLCFLVYRIKCVLSCRFLLKNLLKFANRLWKWKYRGRNCLLFLPLGSSRYLIRMSILCCLINVFALQFLELIY